MSAPAATRAGALLQAATVVLTNGASIQISAARKPAANIFQNFDVFNHTLWRQNKLMTAQMLEAEQNFVPDYSSFYKRRGGRSGPSTSSGANVQTQASSAKKQQGKQ